MKGLIRNNLYSVGSTLKWMIAFCLVVNAVAAILFVYYPGNGSVLLMAMNGQMGAFTGLTGTALQKDNASKWSKFERTLPVKMSDVVKARYLSFLLFSLIGTLLASVTVLLYVTVCAQPANLERVGYGYTLGILLALVVPALLYPLVLRFGSDKSEMLLFICIMLVIGLFIGGSFLSLGVANAVYRSAWMVLSAVLFIASYFVSLAIYRRKEL